MVPKQRRFHLIVIAAILLLTSGCAGTFKFVDPKVSAPAKGKALVLFMRPKRLENLTGGSSMAKLYDGDTFIGEVPYKAQLAYQADPGEHLFMVANSNADFLKASLKAGKTYYVVVESLPNAATFLLGSNNMGFTLRPQNGQIDQKGLDKWFKVMRQVEPTPKGYQVAEKWEPKRKKLKENYYIKWMKKPEQDRPYLAANSGQ